MEFFNVLGKLKRSDYWVRIFFVYFVLALGYGFNILLQGTDAGVFIGGALLFAAAVFTMLSLVVAAVQRTRDANISPWWTVLLAVPTVGFVALVVFGCLPSREET